MYLIPSLCSKNNLLYHEICILGTQLNSILPYVLGHSHPDHIKGGVSSMSFNDLGARKTSISTSGIIRADVKTWIQITFLKE